MQQSAAVSLDAATDKLQGVLDAVSSSINQVLGGYKSVKASCLAELSASAKRLEAERVLLTEVETKRQVSLERTAGFEAELANLVTQETEAHQSYESAVDQRGAALQKHTSGQKTHTEQANAVGEVLEMMKQKKAMVAASQENPKDWKVVPPASPTASASSMDYVIGVMSNMKESSLKKAKEGAVKHNKDDADLERLVESYKTSLQHLDKQYQTQNARRMKVKVAARDLLEEKGLRNMVVDGEEKLDKEYVSFCGAAGNGGSVPAAIEAADFLLAQFKQRTNNAVNTMDKLPDLQSAASSLLSMAPSKQLRGAPRLAKMAARRNRTSVVPGLAKIAAVGALTSAPAATSGGDSAQESAARWVMEQAAKFKDGKTQQLAKAVSASFPNGVPAAKPHPVRIVAPAQPIHALVGASRTQQTLNQSRQGASDPASKEAAAVVACMKEKQDLTDKIIAARKAARVSRTDRMSAEGRKTAVKEFQDIASKQKAVLAPAQKSAEAGWKPLRGLNKAGSLSADITDAIAEMTSIENDVKEYIAAGGPPASAGLPTALAGIKETLNKAKTILKNDMTKIEEGYLGGLMISYPALINQLDTKGKDFKMEEDAMADAIKYSDETAKAEEQKVADLMTQRAGVEYRCMEAGQCAHMHYQQCCSGAASFPKKVMSWDECAAHCEAKIKEGKQIAGCELTDLHKEDDRSGSGTCYAQTTCTLKASKGNCAASLCKVKPPDN